MKKRLKFKCWNCGRDFSLFLDLKGQPKLTIECPYCGASCIADLNPYRNEKVEITKDDSGQEINLGEAYDFPEVIPTTQPEG